MFFNGRKYFKTCKITLFFWVLDDTFVDELRDLYYATLYVSEAHMLKNYIFNFVYPINILK